MIHTILKNSILKEPLFEVSFWGLFSPSQLHVHSNSYEEVRIYHWIAIRCPGAAKGVNPVNSNSFVQVYLVSLSRRCWHDTHSNGWTCPTNPLFYCEGHSVQGGITFFSIIVEQWGFPNKATQRYGSLDLQIMWVYLNRQRFWLIMPELCLDAGVRRDETRLVCLLVQNGRRLDFHLASPHQLS
jgi:hypothetical protein